MKYAAKFIAESNQIEGIVRPPTPEEVGEFYRFMHLKVVTVDEIQNFVRVYQPDARLRDATGLDVRVGNYLPPRGGPEIKERLERILRNASKGGHAFETHLAYEGLHPFTDGNGRSGRMLWAWQMGIIPPIGFLHAFYYQTLAKT